MPTIPLYQDQQQPLQSAPLPGVRVSTDMPTEAFGAGPSAQALHSATQSALGEIQKAALEQKFNADQLAHVQADGAASDLQTKIQVNVAKLKGQDALGAPDLVKQQWDDGVAKISGGLQNDQQRMAFQRSSMQRYNELNRSTQLHVGEQIQAFDDQATQSYLDKSKNAAVLNAGDLDKVQAEEDRSKAAIADWAKRKGIPTTEGSPGYEIYQQKLTSELSGLHRDVIQEQLNHGLEGPAKAYFEAHKDQMSASDIMHTENAVENQDVITQGNDIFSQIQSTKGLKFSDGTYNVEKIREFADNNAEDLSDKRKEKLIDFVTSRAKAFNTNKNQQDASLERSFMNEAIKARKNGVPYDQAMQLVNKYGTDAYDQSVKSDAIGKIYAPPSQSNPQTFIDLWSKTYDGQGSRQDIDQAMQKGQINESDWRSLREMDYKAKTDGTDPLTKNADDRVRIMADEEFGSNKDAKAKFLYDYHHDTQDKTPEEKYKIAKDKLAMDPSTGVMGFFQSRNYEASVKKNDADSLALGKVYSDVGPDETKAIGAGSSKGKPWGLNDIQAFSQNFGGYSKIKQGTPVNNAVKSLNRAGVTVNVHNVNEVLKRHSDGNWDGKNN